MVSQSVRGPHPGRRLCGSGRGRGGQAMKFGIFYELQLPRPWLPGGELQLYQNALDQVELADRLGYDYAWEVEHHFLEEYSHSPSPEVFLAAASQRTKRIRLAHGIMQLTTTHPARCAERIAALDLVSNGRAEFGTGESASITELQPFGVAFEEKRAIWEGGAPPRRWHPVLPVRAALLRAERQPRAAGAGHGQSVGRIREVEARQPQGIGPRARGRPHRLAGDASAQIAAVRNIAHRLG